MGGRPDNKRHNPTSRRMPVGRLLRTPEAEIAWALERLTEAEKALPLRIDLREDRVTVPYFTARHVIQLSIANLEDALRRDKGEKI